MILAAGLSPAWQQILRFDAVARGQVNRARDAHWCASGKVINAALALHHLSVGCAAITALGGPGGNAIRRELADLAIPCEAIETQAATRVCTTLIEQDGATTELVQNAEPLQDGEWQAFVDRVHAWLPRATAVVLSGSLPPGVPREIYHDLVAACQVPTVLDARGPEMLAALAARPTVVKPNREELGQTAGRALGTDRDLLGAMRELNQRGAQWVVVTAGRDTVWATSCDETWRCRPPALKAVNAIGSGDTLAATLAWRLAEGDRLPDALRWAVAAAAENVLHLLPARINLDGVRRRAAEIALQRELS